MRLSDERFTLLGMIVVSYVTYLVWFCGWPIPNGIPLSETDHEAYRKSFETTAIKDEMTSVDFEDFMQKDDGATIALVTKLKYRDELQYPSKLPDDFVKADDVDAALSTLQTSSIWLGLQSGNVPVAVFNQQGNLIRPSERTSIDDDEDEDEMVGGGDSSGEADGWDQVWVMRFRSRRDLLDVLLQFDETGLYYHRVAAIEKLEAAVVSNAGTYFFSLDIICHIVVAFFCTVLFLLSEACFPPPPPEPPKTEKKPKSEKKKVSKKATAGPKDGSKSPKKQSKKEPEPNAEAKKTDESKKGK